MLQNVLDNYNFWYVAESDNKDTDNVVGYRKCRVNRVGHMHGWDGGQWAARGWIGGVLLHS